MPFDNTLTSNTLPANIEAEQALLGILLYDNAAYERIDGLTPAHFHEGLHGRIYELIETAIRRGQMVDPVLLAEKLSAEESFHEMGGIRFLANLVDSAPPSPTARDYAETIRDAALRRDLIRIAADIDHEARPGVSDLNGVEQLEQAEQALFRIAEKGQASAGLQGIGAGVVKAIETAAAAYQRDGGLSGISTGLTDLDRMLGGLHPSDLIIIAARPSMGKAQPLGAKILLRDGSWRPMGELRLGDDLASTDGAPSRVAGVFPQGQRQVYRVAFSDGRVTRACGEHLWRVESCKFEDARVLSTDQLREMLKLERYRRRLTVPVPSGHFGADAALPMEPWLLGALIGNGGMTTNSLMFSTQDAATLYRVQQAVGHDCVNSGGGDYDYRLVGEGGAAAREALKALELWGGGSPEKFIPPAYLRASRESRLELLRGLMDTDGWVEAFGAVRYATSSPRLATDIQALVRSLGGLCTIAAKKPAYTHNGERREGLPSYVCNIRHPDRGSLLSLKRKQRRCVAGARFRNPTIVSIEPDGIEPVQCIRVTHPSSLYITDDYVVTHNTALGTNIAFNVAKAYAYEQKLDGTRKTVAGGRVAFFSLEMSSEQLALRILSEVSGVSSDRVRRGDIKPHEFGLFREAAELVETVPLHVDDTGGISIAKLAARARRMKRSGGLDLIVVDYVQLVTTEGRRKTDNRVQEVTEITMGLKALAKELSVPVIALAQLSRQVENREDKKPQLADLRESGSIEQDADVVMFIYREAYYLGRAEPKADSSEHEHWLLSMDACRHQADVIIGKQRHGPIGSVKLHFDEHLTKFSNLQRESPLMERLRRGADV